MRAIPGSNRVNRGGNFNNTAQNARPANRNNNSPGNRNNNLGARLLSTGPLPDGEGSRTFLLCVPPCPSVLIRRRRWPIPGVGGPAKQHRSRGGW